MTINLCFGISNISIGAFGDLKKNMVNFLLGLLLLLLAAILAIAAFTHTQKLHALRRESQIRE